MEWDVEQDRRGRNDGARGNNIGRQNERRNEGQADKSNAIGEDPKGWQSDKAKEALPKEHP